MRPYVHKTLMLTEDTKNAVRKGRVYMASRPNMQRPCGHQKKYVRKLVIAGGWNVRPSKSFDIDTTNTTKREGDTGREEACVFFSIMALYAPLLSGHHRANMLMQFTLAGLCGSGRDVVPAAHTGGFAMKTVKAIRLTTMIRVRFSRTRRMRAI